MKLEIYDKNFKLINIIDVLSEESAKAVLNAIYNQEYIRGILIDPMPEVAQKWFTIYGK